MNRTRARLARRTLPALAAVTGASLLVAGMTVPSYAADPTINDVVGKVTNAAGAPLAGITIAAHTGPDYRDDVAYVQTDATGTFAFKTLESGSYKFLNHAGHPTGSNDYNAIPYMYEYNGDVQDVRLSPAVAVTADAPGAAVTFALTQYGLITGTNTSNGAPLYHSWADAISVDGIEVQGDSSPVTKIDPATGQEVDGDPNVPGTQAIAQGGQAYRMFVEPGSYKVRLGGRNFTADNPATPVDEEKSTYYVQEFFGGKYSLADAKIVKVAAGQTLAGVGSDLDLNLKSLVKARIDGQPAPGKTLRANTGRWSSGHDYTHFGYSWAVNGVVVSTTSSYVVKKADLKKKIVLTITAVNGDGTGVAQLSTKVGLKNKLSAKGKAAGNGKVKFSLKLSGKKLAGKFKGKAEVWYLPIEAKDEFSFTLNGLKSVTPKRVGKGKVSANGTATITTKKVDEGKGLFMVVYKGSKKAAANETAWKAVKVK